MTPMMTPAVAMLLEVGTKLAPLEWIGTACGMIAAAAILVVAAHEMVSRRLDMDFPSRPRTDVQTSNNCLHRAA